MTNSCLLVFEAFNFFEMTGFPSVLGPSYKLLMAFVLRIITLSMVLMGFFYPCDLNLEVLSLRLGFNLVIHIDGISHPCDSNLEFLPLSLDSNLVILINGIFYPCDLNLEFLSLKLDFNLVIHIDRIFYPCDLNLEFLSSSFILTGISILNFREPFREILLFRSFERK